MRTQQRFLGLFYLIGGIILLILSAGFILQCITALAGIMLVARGLQMRQGMPVIMEVRSWWNRMKYDSWM